MAIYYYSINTVLSQKITEKYFNNVYHVWCASSFACNGNPPSSNPKNIYLRLLEDTNGDDKHSTKIKENKAGLKKAGRAKKEAGIINDTQFNALKTMINNAGTNDFRPLIYIVQADKVKDIVKEVEIKIMARPLGEEYLIEELQREHFDIIDI